MAKTSSSFRLLNISVLTVSNTRSLAEVTSSDTLISLMKEASHTLQDRQIVKDDVYAMHAVVSN